MFSPVIAMSHWPVRPAAGSITWPFFSRNGGESCSGGFFYQTIATHEFGHAVGIDHNRCADSIMYPYASYCETNTLTAADLACLAKLY